VGAALAATIAAFYVSILDIKTGGENNLFQVTRIFATLSHRGISHE